MRLSVRVLVAALFSVCVPIVASGAVGAAPPADCEDLPGPANITVSETSSESTTHSAVVAVVGSAPAGTHFLLEGNGETATYDEHGVLESSVPGPGAPHEYFGVADDGGALSVVEHHEAVPEQTVSTSSQLFGPFPGPSYVCVLIIHTHTTTNLRTTVTFSFEAPDPSSGVAGETTSARAASAVAAAPALTG